MEELTIGKIITALEEADEMEEKIDDIVEEGKEPPTLDVLIEAGKVISKLNGIMRMIRYR